MMTDSNSKDDGLNDSNHTTEAKEPGCFDFFAKKEVNLKPEHDVIIEEPRKENKEDLRRSHSQSSSSGDEESQGEQKKNKKTLKDNTNGEDGHDIEVVDVDEKKGFLENIKAHLPGSHTKTKEGVPSLEPTHENDCQHMPEEETKEKKGMLEKIKEKLHKNGEGEIEENKKEK